MGTTGTDYLRKQYRGAAVFNSANIAYATGVTAAVTFDSEEHDTDAIHSVAATTSRLTVPAGLAGKWRVWAQIIYAAGAVGTRECELYRNGATLGTGINLNASAAGTTGVGQSATLTLAAGDYMEVFARHSQGANLDVVGLTGRTVFGMEYLGP